VVKNDGSGATQFAFVWNIFNTNSSDYSYGRRGQLHFLFISNYSFINRYLLRFNAHLETHRARHDPKHGATPDPGL
jgi:hypothetical protein